jgi:1-acyl-sn-glycerol-3-phosphate acyltransferase
MRLLQIPWIFTRTLAAWVNTLFFSVLLLVLMPLVGPSRGWLMTRREWGVSTLWLLGVKLDVEGAENLAGPAVYIGNHQSLIDIVLFPAILPRSTRIVAKREILLVPLFGWAFGMGGAVLVDRRNPRAAIANIRKGLERLPKNWSVAVFPEGTRSEDRITKPFKKGAFHIAREAHLPIVPIGMDGAPDIVAPNGWLLLPGTVRVVVGKPISTESWTTENLQSCVAQGEAAVAVCVERAQRHRAEGVDVVAPDSDESFDEEARGASDISRHMHSNTHGESQPLAPSERP